MVEGDLKPPHGERLGKCHIMQWLFIALLESRIVRSHLEASGRHHRHFRTCCTITKRPTRSLARNRLRWRDRSRSNAFWSTTTDSFAKSLRRHRGPLANTTTSRKEIIVNRRRQPRSLPTIRHLGHTTTDTLDNLLNIQSRRRHVLRKRCCERTIVASSIRCNIAGRGRKHNVRSLWCIQSCETTRRASRKPTIGIVPTCIQNNNIEIVLGQPQARQ